MAKIQVEHITSIDSGDFQKQIAIALVGVETLGREFVDIKYGISRVVAPGTMQPQTEYGALVISKK